MKFPNVSIIGCGNLAYHLSKNLENIGVNIINIYSRDIKKARKLVSELYNADAVDSLDFSLSPANIFFLCISDDAIQLVSNEILLPPNAILVHCSGSVSLGSIANSNSETGVFYPVQTFTKDRKINFIETPVCIEASSLKTENILEHLAKAMKSQPFFMNSQQRLTLHLAAVFACNFGNHLFSISKLILKEQNLPFSLLHHLIAETVQKAIENDPVKMQTGPAIRKDQKTMALHGELIGENLTWQKLYKLISSDIVLINELNSR
ncbi:MAG: DUF2520 domain-containing protein [Opitutaceae bacterium]|nr:DUF2520 domain-containing protein [Cytophagales bacterium]